MGNLIQMRQSEVNAGLEALASHGVRPEHWDFLCDPQFGGELAAFWTSRGGQKFVSFDEAARIMGNQIWGPEDWLKLPGVKARLTDRQLEFAGRFPWGPEILNNSCDFRKGQLVKQTHFAFFGPERIGKQKTTILQFQKWFPNNGQPRFASYALESWYASDPSANKTTLRFRWYLLLIDAVPGSVGLSLEAQQALLPAEYEAPNCVEEVAKDLFVIRKTGIFPNPSVYARCADSSANGSRLSAGRCDRDGVVICCWLGHAYPNVGLAASRKVPSRILNS